MMMYIVAFVDKNEQSSFTFNMITLPDGNKYVVPQLKEFEYQELLRQLDMNKKLNRLN